MVEARVCLSFALLNNSCKLWRVAKDKVPKLSVTIVFWLKSISPDLDTSKFRYLVILMAIMCISTKEIVPFSVVIRRS